MMNYKAIINRLDIEKLHEMKTYLDKHTQQIEKEIVLDPPKFLFITSNLGKLTEVRNILNTFHIESLALSLPEFQGTPLSIATEKCLYARTLLNDKYNDNDNYNKYKNYTIITEDTSLCFNAMNNLPGPYIKWFVEDLGCDGLNKMLKGFDDKTAYAQCIFAVLKPNSDAPLIFDGRCNGKIVDARNGDKLSFCWDPIFEPDGSDKTFAEMSIIEKNKVSHRYNALMLFKDYYLRLKLELHIDPIEIKWDNSDVGLMSSTSTTFIGCKIYTSILLENNFDKNFDKVLCKAIDKLKNTSFDKKRYWLVPNNNWSHAMTTNIDGYTISILHTGEHLLCKVCKGTFGQLQF